MVNFHGRCGSSDPPPLPAPEVPVHRHSQPPPAVCRPRRGTGHLRRALLRATSTRYPPLPGPPLSFHASIWGTPVWGHLPTRLPRVKVGFSSGQADRPHRLRPGLGYTNNLIAALRAQHAEQHRRVFRVAGRMPTMTCTAAAVQQTVDRTPRGAFNRPF